jgi:DNA invertase Pin-like site-specific DNA recombinase
MTKSSSAGRAIIYARKSSKQDNLGEQSASVADQIELGRRYAEHEDRAWTVVGEFTDDGRSGLLDRSRRPGLDAALRMIEEGKADKIVMLWKSRLSRDELDRASLLRDLERWGCEWHAVRDGGLVDRSTYAGFVKDAADAMIDNGHSIRVRENWQRVHTRRLEGGEPKTGNARWGYTRELRYDRRTGREYPSGPFTVDPVTGPVLTRLYERYCAGTGFTPLVVWLNEHGHTTTTGAAWSVRSLSRMLDTGFAAGRISKEAAYRDRIGTHKRIIDEELWQRYLRKRAAKRQVPVKRQAPRWYLAGLVRCGLCGGSTYINSYESQKSAIQCTNRRSNKSCPGVSMYRRELEFKVAVWLGGHIEQWASVVPQRDAERAEVQARVTRLEETLQDDTATLGKLATGWATGLLDDEGYLAAKAELTGTQEARTAELDEARSELDRLGPVARDAYEKLAQQPELTPGEFGAQIGKLLRRIEVHPSFIQYVPMVGEPEVEERPRGVRRPGYRYGLPVGEEDEAA